MPKIKKIAANEVKVISFPSETLSDCREIVSQIVKRKGETTVSFKDISIILGKSTNITLPISSCTQYGILENVHGSGYKATPLFTKMHAPVYPTEPNGILEALYNAPLYQHIIEKFNGKILPDEEGMVNYLTNEFAIKTYIVLKVVRVFYTNFREASLIDGNNRLKYLGPENEENDKFSIPTISPSVETIPQSNHLANEKPSNRFPNKEEILFEQAIDLGDGTAYLKYPRKLNSEQVSILRIHLEATLTALEARYKNELKKEQPEGGSST